METTPEIPFTFHLLKLSDSNLETNAYPNLFDSFQLEWTPDSLKFSIDDTELGTLVIPEGGMWENGQFDTDFPGTVNPWEGQAKNAPFDKPFYLILNNACGGTA